MSVGAERRIAARFRSRFLRSYSRSKLRTDPVYGAALAALRDVRSPLLDIGCGIGLLEFYLRENGWDGPITGIDHDQRKIAVAREVARHYPGVEFREGDARAALPPGVSVAALDLVHYFTVDEQKKILEAIAGAVPPGGVAVIRDAVRDASVRFRITALQERFARAVHWLRADRLRFVTREEIEAPFRARGFDVKVTPAWGRTPFNNYLFVFRRSGEGMTKR